MSDYVFPAIPGIFIEPEISSSFGNTAHQTISGKKQVTNWQGSAINRYRIRGTVRMYVSAPGDWGGYSEAEAFRYFWDAHRGDWDSWLMDDPFTRSRIRVRFAADSFRMTESVRGMWWDVEAEVETVL